MNKFKSKEEYLAAKEEMKEITRTGRHNKKVHRILQAIDGAAWNTFWATPNRKWQDYEQSKASMLAAEKARLAETGFILEYIGSNRDARHAHVAYSAMRGRSYAEIEGQTLTPLSLSSVTGELSRYLPDEEAEALAAQLCAASFAVAKANAAKKKEREALAEARRMARSDSAVQKKEEGRG